MKENSKTGAVKREYEKQVANNWYLTRSSH
jgi:hypothetical protein